MPSINQNSSTSETVSDDRRSGGPPLHFSDKTWAPHFRSPLPLKGYAATLLLAASVVLTAAVWMRTAQQAKVNRALLETAKADRLRAVAAEQSAEKTAENSDKASRHLRIEVDRLHAALALALESPEQRKAREEQSNTLALSRIHYQRAYAAFFRDRAISPATRKALLALLVDQSEQDMDIFAAAQGQHLSERDPAAQEALAEVNRQTEAAEAGVLGPADFAAFQDYQKTMDARFLVSQWAGGVAVELGEPLNPAQGQALLKAIEDASPTYRQGNDLDIAQVDWTAVARAAQSFLTPRQLNFILAAEPPIPNGGRFQSSFYRLATSAQQSETPSPQ